MHGHMFVKVVILNPLIH